MMTDSNTDSLGDLPIEEAAVVRDAGEVDVLIERIQLLDKSWETGTELDGVTVGWSPHLIRPEKRWVLHVHLSVGAPRYVARRLAAAAEGQHIVHVALAMETLYDEDVLELLSQVDAYVYVVKADGKPTRRRHYLAALADLGVPVAPELRRRLAQAAWQRIGEGTENQRGRRLEALLAFLLAQVADLRVLQRNYRTQTAEIDIVLQIDNHSARCWNEPGVPFVFVESKNTVDRAGQPVVTQLIRRLQTSRGRARIGLLFSVGGFTEDAKLEELRQSEGNLCVAFFDSEALESLMAADDLDVLLDGQVASAMLR